MDDWIAGSAKYSCAKTKSQAAFTSLQFPGKKQTNGDQEETGCNGRVGVCVVQDRENYWGAGDLGGRLEGGRAWVRRRQSP